MLVLAVGGFGRRVAQRLSTVDSSVAAIDVTTGTHPAAWPDADLYVLAAEWEADELVEMVESSAFAWRRPWFPVLLDHPHLRVGPVVVPGQSACHRCFDRRRRQHAKSPQPSWRQTTTVPGTGSYVRGYADHHVTLAAGLVLQAAQSLGAEAFVRTVHLVDGSVGRAGVIAADGCDRCRERRDHASDLASIAAELEEALSHG